MKRAQHMHNNAIGALYVLNLAINRFSEKLPKAQRAQGMSALIEMELVKSFTPVRLPFFQLYPRKMRTYLAKN